jgi:hypothetical protein
MRSSYHPLHRLKPLPLDDRIAQPPSEAAAGNFPSSSEDSTASACLRRTTQHCAFFLFDNQRGCLPANEAGVPGCSRSAWSGWENGSTRVPKYIGLTMAALTHGMAPYGQIEQPSMTTRKRTITHEKLFHRRAQQDARQIIDRSPRIVRRRHASVTASVEQIPNRPEYGSGRRTRQRRASRRPIAGRHQVTSTGQQTPHIGSGKPGATDIRGRSRSHSQLFSYRPG